MVSLLKSAGRTSGASRQDAKPPRLRRWRDWWALLAVVTASLPVAGALVPGRVFFTRDLSMFFWGRYLWLRRSLYSGVWPLWDPFIGGGQSAVADALHQMFLLPVVVLRLVGTEVIGFNLWIALPFPLAALGTYLFLARRFSRPAAALGAVVFAVCGPVVSAGNMPNLSWSVVAMPWVLWATDRFLGRRKGVDVAWLSAAFAFQSLAGEPVTLVATGAVALAYSLVVGAAAGTGRRDVLGGAAIVAFSLALGMAGAAIQLMPLGHAASGSFRQMGTSKEFWSLHPVAIAEMFSPRLFGDYFGRPVSELPWMMAINDGRDPFFYSTYFGFPVAALALMGILAARRRWWAGVWSAIAVLGALAALGWYTPFYPTLRHYLPVVGMFRFPVKYLLIVALAVAALAAAGWDSISRGQRERGDSASARRAGPLVVASLALAAVLSFVVSVACISSPRGVASAFEEFAAFVGATDPKAAADTLLHGMPDACGRALLVAVSAALLFGVGLSPRRGAGVARAAVYALVLLDLSQAAWGLNPTFDAKYFEQPSWTRATRSDPQSRLYFGGKFGGSVLITDVDAPKSISGLAAGLSPAQVKAIVWAQGVSFPAAYGVREIVSYDLPVLWPREFEVAFRRFRRADREARDRFLWRTGVRFRILPAPAGGGRSGSGIDLFPDVRLFDWGPVVPRASVVADAVVVPKISAQTDLLFGADFDPTRVVAVTVSEASMWGTPGAPTTAFARVLAEDTDRVTIEAGAPAGGGYLLLLDSYSPDWAVSVDGGDARLLRANALFRAVHLAPGRHAVQFRYRPLAFYWGAAISTAAWLGIFAMGWLGRRREPPVAAKS